MEDPEKGRFPAVGKALTMSRVHGTASPGVGITEPRWVTTGEVGHRIDPRALESRRTFVMGGTRYAVEARGATVHAEEGVSVALRPHEFEGVAARASEDIDGLVTVTLELMHADERLSVPLLVAHDLDDVAADWRDWARLFGLQMLMVEADGTVEALQSIGTPGQPLERRRRATKRPRFLLRRRMGSLGVTMRSDGRELIARR